MNAVFSGKECIAGISMESAGSSNFQSFFNELLLGRNLSLHSHPSPQAAKPLVFDQEKSNLHVWTSSLHAEQGEFLKIKLCYASKQFRMLFMHNFKNRRNSIQITCS